MIIKTVQELQQLQQALKDYNDIIGFDYETEGLFPITDKVVSAQLSVRKKTGGIASFYLPIGHYEQSYNLPREEIQKFMEFLCTKKIVPFNATFEMSMTLTNFNLHLPIYADPQIMAAVMGEETLSLKELIKLHFDIQSDDFDGMMKSKFGVKWKSQKKNCAELTPEELYPYAIKDPEYTIMLYDFYLPKLEPFKSIYKLELNLLPIIVKMNLLPRVINSDLLDNARKQAENRVAELSKLMNEEVGWDFKPNSVRDVTKILYEQFGLPVLKTSAKTGAPSSDKEVMKELSSIHPFPGYLMEFRSLNKFIKEYLFRISAIKQKVGFLYASFNQLGAELI